MSYPYEKKANGQSKRRVLEAHGRKSEIQNPNSPMFKTKPA